MSSPGVYQQRHWLRTRACALEVYGSAPRRGSRRGTRSEAVDAPVFSEPQRSLACSQMSAGEQPWIFFFFFLRMRRGARQQQTTQPILRGRFEACASGLSQRNHALASVSTDFYGTRGGSLAVSCFCGNAFTQGFFFKAEMAI